MGAFIDLTGQTYGRLTAIERVGTASGGAKWLWQCECGVRVEAVAAHVRHGKRRSCGCLRRETTSELKSVDLVGQEFGRLTVECKRGVNKFRFVEWACRCECGATTAATTHALRSGSKRSCGCLHRETISAIQKAKALPADEKRRRVLANRAAQREKRKTDPAKAMHARISRLHRWALAQVGGVKKSPTLEALGYSAEELVAHIERQFVNGMGWHNMADWQIDHIIPVSEARCENDVVALNQLSNLRPLWAGVNNRKKNRRELLI